MVLIFYSEIFYMSQNLALKNNFGENQVCPNIYSIPKLTVHTIQIDPVTIKLWTKKMEKNMENKEKNEHKGNFTF